MARGIRRDLSRVAQKVQAEIASHASGGFYAAGHSAEGFHGGYLAALYDVQLALSGMRPSTRNWWADFVERPEHRDI